jgi:proteic killer suppression protein
MIKSIKGKTTQDIFDGVNSKEARKVPTEVHKIAQRKLDMINAAFIIDDLRVPPGNRLEALSGNLKGFFSIRINQQWRIIFKWNQGAELVEIVDYH